MPVFKLAVSLFLIVTLLSGCAVAYTFFNSEGKLDRLSPNLQKEQVVEKIGEPDMVLRDDGRVIVWHYNMNTRRQWLYELALCPVSVWVGGCLFYPVTNWVAEHHREHPIHVILINNRLCVWGHPPALLQKRKGCTEGGPSAEHAGMQDTQTREAYPFTTGYGPINSDLIDWYHTMAVMPFADAPDAPGSGAKVSGIVANLLLDLDVTIVERAKLEQVFNEQVVQLKYSAEADALRIGHIAGAKAVVVGDVQQCEAQDKTAKVALSLRIIDVETGQLLFGGEGHSNEPISAVPDNLARLIVHRIMTRFGVKAGLLGTGRTGVEWVWREVGGSRVFLVQDILSGSPADKAGLKIGDMVLACNGISITSTRTQREAKHACQIDAGQTLSLEVLRGDRRLRIQAVAERRPGM